MKAALYEFKNTDHQGQRSYIFQMIKNRKLTDVYHSHDFYEIIWFLKGSGVQRINEREWVHEQNAMILLRPGDRHCFVGQSRDIEVASLSVKKEEFEQFATAYDARLLKLIDTHDTPIRISSAPLTLWNTYGKTPQNVTEYDCKLFLSYCLSVYITRTDCLKQSSGLPPMLAQAIEEMKKVENLKIGIPAFMELSHYSQSHLARLIKTHFGMSLKQYVNELRLQSAYSDMVLTNKSAEEISEGVGFFSFSHFNKIFKARFSVTPAALRKSNGVYGQRDLNLSILSVFCASNDLWVDTLPTQQYNVENTRHTRRTQMIKELVLEELTTKQKLGMTLTALIQSIEGPFPIAPVLDLIKKHALGGVFVQGSRPNYQEIVNMIKEAADYPILIMTDAERGIAPYQIGSQNAIGRTGSAELAYLFGKAMAIRAREIGFNVVTSPVLDMCHENVTCGGNNRALGHDKHEVARLAAAEVRGIHDGGVLSVAKHYPGTPDNAAIIDAHMAENEIYGTEQDLLDYNLHPYLQLMKENLLDGVMTGHYLCTAIDRDYPASLSSKVTSILRRQGFDGFYVTDGLNMMGVVAKFGNKGAIGLSVAHGNDLALAFQPTEMAYEALCESYEKGQISEERLNEAVRHVLEAQHKTTLPQKFTELTEEEKIKFQRINTDCVYAKTDEGTPVSISREGRHFFAILTDGDVDLNTADVDVMGPMAGGWYRPREIAKQLGELFPNSTVSTINQFPSSAENRILLDRSLGYDDVIFITFFNSDCYVGTECLTSRILSLMNAMQVTNRISTIVHFGNPYVVEDAPHVSRLVLGAGDRSNVAPTLEVLAGLREPLGVLTYDVKFK